MARPKSEATNIAFNTIKDRINNYDLVPGDTVSDLNLSNELNMSRTPIREAIILLEQCNLIVKEKHKYVVRDIRQEDINEILDIRIAIESLAAKLIIENGGLTKDQIAILEDLEVKYNKSIEDKNYNLNFKIDSTFHKNITEFSGNKRLFTIMKNISIQGERLRWMSILTPSRVDTAAKEHKDIVQYLREKNQEKVIETITNHLNLTRINYNKITEGDSWESIIISLKKAFQ